MSTVALVPGRRLRRAEKAALALEMVGAYRRARRLLRRADLAEVIARERARRPSPGRNARVSHDEALRLAAAVCRVMAVVPGDSRCLARSLVLADLLARRGVPTSLVIAVRPRPFQAHAWLELAGRPLLPPAHPPFRRLLEVAG